MRSNLSSQITLSRVPSKLYQTKDALELARLTRREKIKTTIVENATEGSTLVASRLSQLRSHRGLRPVSFVVE